MNINRCTIVYFSIKPSRSQKVILVQLCDFDTSYSLSLLSFQLNTRQKKKKKSRFPFPFSVIYHNFAPRAPWVKSYFGNINIKIFESHLLQPKQPVDFLSNNRETPSLTHSPAVYPSCHLLPLSSSISHESLMDPLRINIFNHFTIKWHINSTQLWRSTIKR